MTATPEQLADLIAERLDLDRLAAAIAHRLERKADPGEWITAKDCAQRFGHSAKWWREHKAEFGAVPDGDGPRPRLMFNPAEVARVLAARRL